MLLFFSLHPQETVWNPEMRRGRVEVEENLLEVAVPELYGSQAFEHPRKETSALAMLARGWEWGRGGFDGSHKGALAPGSALGPQFHLLSLAGSGRQEGPGTQPHCAARGPKSASDSHVGFTCAMLIRLLVPWRCYGDPMRGLWFNYTLGAR